MTSGLHFSQCYAEARAKFLAAAAAAELRVTSHLHPLAGCDGEPLAVDVALDGAPDMESLLIISSGCHGVEGYCGSGIQISLLHDRQWRALARNAGIAVLYIHALNPYGFSWSRRTTHENIDLNRNVQDFSKPLPVNREYDALAELLVPDRWPPTPGNWLALLGFVARHGIKAMQAAISRGQYAHPRGLFYGGSGPSWSHDVFRRIMREHGQYAGRITCIDLHTGLGPKGVGERIFTCRNDTAALQRARAWWGKDVTSDYDGSSVSASVSGQLWNVIYEECPQAEYTGIALEYGTVSMRHVLHALRADQWLENHPEAPDATRRRIKRQIRDAFYVDTEEWKSQVVEQARKAARQAVRGLNDNDPNS